MKKKLNSKLIIIITASVLAIALIATLIAVILNKAGDATVSFGSKKAIAGDTVEMPFSIDKNPGIWGGQIILNYDSDALSFVSCSNGDVFDECEVNDDNGSLVILVNQAELEDTDKNGVVATVSFKVKVSADKGDYDITFDSETNFCNVTEVMVEPILEKGTITVK